MNTCTLDKFINNCISYKKLSREFYLLKNQAYKVVKNTLVPDKNKIENLLLLIDPMTNNVIGEAIVYEELKTIEAFIIFEEYRRMGYGEKFIKFCIKNFNIDNIEVLTDNLPALKLYKKCGFRIDSKYKSNRNSLYKMILESPKRNYADVLESYLIPAEESLLFTNIKEENISKLGEKRSLIVFTTDNSLKFGGITPKKYISKYNYSNVVELPFDKYFRYKLGVSKECPNIDFELKEMLNNPKNVSVSDDMKVSDVIYDIIKTCDTYSKLKNTLVIIYFLDPRDFCYRFMRDYPIIITHISMIRSVMNRLTSSSSLSIGQIIYSYLEFEILDKKIPKSAYIKDMKFDLYHISPNANIKELIPRITDKPLRHENIGIPRISAAPSVDACFRAIGLGGIDKEKDRKRKYYVYKLRINKDTIIVKPTTRLVPDQEYTNEYWVLDKVPVDLVGSITVSIDENNNYVFDSSKMPVDPLITTKHRYIKNK